MWQTKSESGEKLQENASKSINSIHSSEVIQGARKKNVELCIYVYEAFLDEVQIGHFHFWLRKSRPTFRLINSRKLENFHSIIEFIATDEGINEKNAKLLYEAVGEMQKRRLQEARRRFRKQVSNYKIVQRARQANWPSAVKARPLPSLEKMLLRLEEDSVEILQTIDENIGRCLIVSEDQKSLVDCDWSAPEHFGEIESYISDTNSRLHDIARSISDVQKERRERARLNLAVWALAFAVVSKLVVDFIFDV